MNKENLVKVYKNLVKVNDTKLNVYTEGKGKATIVFMSGSGVTSPVLEYRPLYSKLSDNYRVAVIEKCGYGFSSHMTSKRTIENLVLEDRYALKEAGIEPPYILAPHSYSGFEAVYWANTYPEEVKAVLGIDMGFPDHALSMAKEIPEQKKQEIVRRQRDFLVKIAKQGVLSKLLYKKTIDVSGLMSGLHLTSEEKQLYKELFYKNLLNEEISDEAIHMTENAIKAHDSGQLRCPCCFFISNMKTPVKSVSWRESGVSYAKRSGAEYHLTDAGHFLYTRIPDIMADTFGKFIENNVK